MVFHNDKIIKSKGKPGLCFLPISWWNSSLLFISYNLTNRWLLTYNRTELDFILIPENERFHILIKESFQWSLQISWPRVALSAGQVRSEVRTRGRSCSAWYHLDALVFALSPRQPRRAFWFAAPTEPVTFSSSACVFYSWPDPDPQTTASWWTRHCHCSASGPALALHAH